MVPIRKTVGELLIMDGETTGGNVVQLVAGGCETNINEDFLSVRSLLRVGCRLSNAIVF